MTAYQIRRANDRVNDGKLSGELAPELTYHAGTVRRLAHEMAVDTFGIGCNVVIGGRGYSFYPV